jgi:outer membrane protein assembly factor BamE (lipoprotein component of BamABCDE complex)
MNKNKIVFIVLLFAIITLTGCASIIQGQQVKQRQNQLNAKLNPLMGRTKEDVVLAIGAPNSIDVIGTIEVYRYYQSYGTRGNASAYSYNKNTTTASGQSWEAYDKFNIYFKNGIAIKWDGYVQR